MDADALHLLFLAAVFAVNLHAVRRERFWRTCLLSAGAATVGAAVWQIIAGPNLVFLLPFAFPMAVATDALGAFGVAALIGLPFWLWRQRPARSAAGSPLRTVTPSAPPRAGAILAAGLFTLFLYAEKAGVGWAAQSVFEQGIAAHDLSLVRWGLDHGADPNIVPFDMDKPPYTALQRAAEDGDISLIRLLLAHGASADGEPMHIGPAPLSLAIMSGHEEVAAALRAAGAKEEAPPTTPNGVR